ncbi:MAG TPA: HEAT repeat domain-containing protein [Candidatus Aquilonibacter sp.]|nr:HEAT repeat domain-containing protein [Candidatus Aquilonibacter sp.]
MVLLLLALLGVFGMVPFRGQVRSLVLERGLLGNDSPDPMLVADTINASPNVPAAILAFWNTGRIIHREISIQAMRNIVSSSHHIPSELKPLVEAAAIDPDFDVREEALSVLRQCQDPALATMVAIQLRDCDPEVRLLGAQYLRWLGADTGVPMAIHLLDDTDPRVVVNGLIELERCGHQDFGVKLTDIAAAVDDEKTGFKELHPGSELKCRAAAEKAKAWWTLHQAEYGTPAANSSNTPVAAISFPPGAEFEASALDGNKVSLSKLRGKTVLLYFWTTSQGGCLDELEDLMTLEKKYGNDLAIIGVSLDNVKDDDGGIGDDDDLTIAHRQGKCRLPSPGEIREKVAGAVKVRRLDFPIILDDEHLFISGRYNASSVPTTVIIDQHGLIHRRFYGRRSLPVLEAMLDELRQSTNAVAHSGPTFEFTQAFAEREFLKMRGKGKLTS